MKESIGLTATFNIMFIFLIVTFAFIFGTMSYSKAYRASSIIINALEKYEGYNKASKEEIDKKLATLGYMPGNSKSCPETRVSSAGTGELVTLDDTEKKEYCIYYFKEDGIVTGTSDYDKKRHYSYGIVTYVTFDISAFNVHVKLPIYNAVRRIFRFDTSKY